MKRICGAVQKCRQHLWLQVCMIFGVSIAVVIICYHQYMRAEYSGFLLEKNHLMEQEVLKTMQKNLDYSLKEYIDMGASIAVNDEVYSIAEVLNKKDENQEKTEISLKLMFAAMASLSTNVLNISLIQEEGTVYQYDRLYRGTKKMWRNSDSSFLTVMYQQLYKKVQENSVPKYMVSAYPQIHPVTGERVFHIFFPLIGNKPSFSKMNAMISVTFSMDILAPLLELVENDDDTYTKGYITDAFGTIIMHTDEENIGRSEEAYLSNKLLITLDQPLNKLNWNLHIALDKEMLNKSVSKILYNGNKVYIFFLLGLALVFYLLIQKFTRPLNKIQKAMEVTGAGKKRKKVKIEGDNEVWKLAEVYNEMLDKLLQQEQETEKSYRMSLMAIERQHQAEREALETQINAHFLCNTLGTINYEAIEAGNRKVSLLIKKLSNILRYTFDQKCQNVYMSQEFAWIEQYLYLQKARFEDAFDYEIDLQEEYDMWPCCKLMLQPFVENAIIHGFKGREIGGMLKIMAKGQGEYIKIVINDNGYGIPEEREKAIQEIIKGNDVSDDLRIGIGIRNVVARIHIFYGDSAQISLWSKEGEGTKFEFLLPYPERKEECI